MRTFEINEAKYWQNEFKALAGRERLTEFMVINMEALKEEDFSVSRATIKQKFKMVEVEVCRKSEYGTENAQTFIVNTHLGEYLNYFDTVLGYDIDNMALGVLDDYRN